MMTRIDPNNTQAILIGASEFDNDGLENLPNVISNVAKLNRLLIEVVGIDKNKICMMLDRDNPSEITSKIIEIIPHVSDTIIVYYAGHGIRHLQNFYFATKKTHPREPEYTGAMPSAHLIRLVIKKAKAKNIIFIFDCCFSAMAKEGVDSGGKQVFFITAAPFNQTAKDEAPENVFNTAFTHELLVVLEQGIENAGEMLTLQTIFNHLKTRLTDKDLPEPQLNAHGSPDKLEICKNRAYQHISSTQEKMSLKTTALYEILKQLSKSQFDEVCFYLKNEYHYDLSYIAVDKVTSVESAIQLINFIEQYPQGLTHLQKLLEKFQISSPTMKTEPITSDKKAFVMSGKTKIKLCQRLTNWQDLADHLEIPTYHRRQFERGRECQGIWEWLEERQELDKLKEALDALGYQHLTKLLNTDT
ncbi:caspase family protein [Candidatus Parabeggiatoa sp. HSG14]|uniref:caspase, EACC1-associated type n=1 Tax=Candidatus Parabeggiatoa sp. HSG14 TaxID=3055593 RepID=UPI0025A70E18|nr:caspase family protein [Thiotrichales bacterium HSG14]